MTYIAPFTPNLDAFGRQQVSDPANRFDVEFIYDKQPLLVDEVSTGGGGTATHNANSRDVTLDINDSTIGTGHELTSHLYVPYTPGNGQLGEITGVLDLADIGSGTAELFIRSTITGTTVETVYDQVDWTDPVPDQNWATSFIFAFKFQSLKVGIVDFLMNRAGENVLLHRVRNDNIRASGYWQSPTLPVYWRVYNSGTRTYMEMGYGDESNAIGIRTFADIGDATGVQMKAICATVKSEGGDKLFDLPGQPFTADMGVTAKTVSTTLIPLISIRPAATINSIVNRGLYIPERFGLQADNPIRYVLLYRPTLTGPSWTAIDSTYSGMEYDVTATAVSGGIAVDSDYLSTAKNTEGGTAGLLGRIILALSKTGTADILTLAAVRTTTTDASTLAAIKGREIR